MNRLHLSQRHKSMQSRHQVVGWPPIRAYRMNSMVNQAKAVATEGFNSTMENHKNETSMVEKRTIGSYQNSGNSKLRKSLFVKVNMDGIPIGRKVDLNAHESYEKLAKTLEDMFLKNTTSVNPVDELSAHLITDHRDVLIYAKSECEHELSCKKI
ncbi:hypothetical protein SCA6_014372 [Theobroma cacao]